ncbi:hypothetical protein [Arboricoccus pini]|nr:hypothetical protein [Arboricoccus pini]
MTAQQNLEAPLRRHTPRYPDVLRVKRTLAGRLPGTARPARAR